MAAAGDTRRRLAAARGWRAGRRPSARPRPSAATCAARRSPPSTATCSTCDTRELRCACRAVRAALRPPRGRRRALPPGPRAARCGVMDFELDDLAWEELRLPVDIAFFFRSSRAGRVRGLSTRARWGRPSRCSTLEAWETLEARQPGAVDARGRRRGAARQPRARRARALARADRRALRARRADPRALARADRRQGGVAGDRAVLRRARPAPRGRRAGRAAVGPRPRPATAAEGG